MSEISGAVGEGFATVARNGVVLDAWFLKLQLTTDGKSGTCPGRPDDTGYARADEIRRVDDVPIRTFIASLQDAPVIPTVAWPTRGPCALDDLQAAQIRARVTAWRWT
ncbi:hypothetical protein BH10PSE6_BH10PSE6_31420 [soil metagenome]